MEEDNIDAITAPSTSFYAVRTSLLTRHILFRLNGTTFIFVGNWYEKFSQSLETRPRSIYDVLDHSAANRKPEPSKAKPKKKEPKPTVSVKLSCFVTLCVISGKQLNICDLSSTSSTGGTNHTRPTWRRIWVCLWELLNIYKLVSVDCDIYISGWDYLCVFAVKSKVKVTKPHCKNTLLCVHFFK